MTGFSKFLCLTWTDWFNSLSFILPVCFSIKELKAKELLCMGQTQTQGPGLLNNTHLAFKVGYSKDLHDVTLSWGQSPLVSPRQRGGGWLSEQRKDKQEREKNVDLQMDLRSRLSMCVYVQKFSIYIHVIQLVDSHMHVCCMADVGRVWVHTRVPNVYVNAIMPCLSGQ